MLTRITGVRNGSIAQEMDIEAGDTLISINGHPIGDILDYQYYAQEDFLQVEIQKASGEQWILEIEKDYDEGLGLEFDDTLFDSLKTCQNRCVFCFVDQLPPDMRKSLYVKDDDYRHSFIYGNFITLTNLREADWAKIEEMHLSPLYVSVHCVQGALRRDMLQHPKAGDVINGLKRLQASGIEVHTQIVLCPGWNDGPVLGETIAALAELYPAVASIGIVPVGLTGFRRGLAELQPVGTALACQTVEMVEGMQLSFRSAILKGLVYLADEFYLKSGRAIPAAEYYDDFCQIENGIGLIRWLWDEFRELEPSLPAQVDPREVWIITSQSGEAALTGIARRLNQIEGLSVNLLPVTNRYFGGEVTVTGLLTGQDIIAALGDKFRNLRVILPAVIFKEGQDILLDGLSLEDILSSSGADIRVAEITALSLVEAITGD